MVYIKLPILEMSTSWANKTKEEIRAYHRERYRKNREEMSRKRREYRARTNNAITKKYEKTFKGFLMRKYRNMQSRVLGIQREKAHLYANKELLPREDFYKWALNHPDYKKLYKTWVGSNYDRKLCPTVDRIDPNQGYFIENMRWLTHSENSRLGSKGGAVTNPKGNNQYKKHT